MAFTREEKDRARQQHHDRQRAPELEPERQLIDKMQECASDVLPLQPTQLSAIFFCLVIDDAIRAEFLAEFADRYANFWGSRQEPGEGTEQQSLDLARMLDSTIETFMAQRPPSET
jgi:hypothetical protein